MPVVLRIAKEDTEDMRISVSLPAVNYPRLKPGACPWRYAIRRVSETYGGLTAARRPILIAAMWSANPAYPQATQEKVL